MELRTHTRQDHEIEHSSNDEVEMSRVDSSIKENEGNFRCDICGFVESTEESLVEHVALHDNQLKCVVCGTILKHKGNLVLHMRIHVCKTYYFIQIKIVWLKNFIHFCRPIRNSSNVINVKRLLFTNHHFECTYKRHTLKYETNNVPNARWNSKQHHNWTSIWSHIRESSGINAPNVERHLVRSIIWRLTTNPITSTKSIEKCKWRQSQWLQILTWICNWILEYFLYKIRVWNKNDLISMVQSEKCFIC